METLDVSPSGDFVAWFACQPEHPLVAQAVVVSGNLIDSTRHEADINIHALIVSSARSMPEKERRL